MCEDPGYAARVFSYLATGLTPRLLDRGAAEVVGMGIVDRESGRLSILPS
jgi:hypothetical protein